MFGIPTPQTMLMKAVVAAIALAVLEMPAVYLYSSRAGVQHDLKAKSEAFDKEHKLRTDAETDLGHCKTAAKESSDSVQAMKDRADAAEALARRLAAANQKAKTQLADLVKQRQAQIDKAGTDKETCDAAIEQLRSGG